MDLHQELKLEQFDLSNPLHGPIEDVGELEDFSSSSLESLDAEEPQPEQEQVDQDVWASISAVDGPDRQAEIQSWDKFYNTNFQGPRSNFLSEARSSVYDVILAGRAGNLALDESKKKLGTLVDPQPLLSSFKWLVLGRESIIYRYDQAGKTFKPRNEFVRITGYSLEIFQSISCALIKHGNIFIFLTAFVAKTQSSRNPNPPALALAAEIMPILSAIEDHIEISWTYTESLLRIHSLIAGFQPIIACLHDIVGFMEPARSADQALSDVFEYTMKHSESTPKLRPLLRRLLRAVTAPWSSSLARLVGLSLDGTQVSDLAGPVVHGSAMAMLTDGHLDFPSFVLEDDVRTIMTTKNSIDILSTLQPDNPIFGNSPKARSEFDWRFHLRDLERINAQARQYQVEVRSALMENPQKKRVSRQEVAQSGASPVQALPTTLMPPATALSSPNAAVKLTFEQLMTLEEADLDCLEIRAPPASMLFRMSFMPLISVQARLVNRACLKLVLIEHDLSLHLSVLHRFLLLSDSAFAAGLSQALFGLTPDGTEHHRDSYTKWRLGLNIGFRNTWPPAGPELRLALSGLLAESYFGNKAQGSCTIFHNELPGGMSFAVREMSEDDMTDCLNPDRVEALDFLKLHYQAPKALHTVITPCALDKYDAVFKMLLRVLRLQFVVQHLPTTSEHPRNNKIHTAYTLFRMESQHFISSLCGYIFDGVTRYWQDLMGQVSSIQASIEDHNMICGSLDEFREYHEELMDRLMMTLLLRNCQGEVSVLINELFNLILQISRRVHAKTSTDDVNADESQRTLGEMYDIFRKKMQVFVNTCRALNEQPGIGGTKASGDLAPEGGNATGQLLLRFEMNKYYTK